MNLFTLPHLEPQSDAEMRTIPRYQAIRSSPFDGIRLTGDSGVGASMLGRPRCFVSIGKAT
jgi:hypothetical protein